MSAMDSNPDPPVQARALLLERAETLSSVIDEHLAWLRSEDGLGVTMTTDAIAKETKVLLSEFSAALAGREPAPETQDEHTVEKFVAWATLAHEVEVLKAEISELRTLAKIGTWHKDCRPNRHMAARELEKSQTTINQLADTITELRAELAALRVSLAALPRYRYDGEPSSHGRVVSWDELNAVLARHE